ncbi:MAG: hypothetical protein AAFQ80_09875 [Cyanobacteria bacterium J06621_8]
MLYEDDVIEAVCTYLKDQDFTILSKCATTEKGDDMIAEHPFGKYNLYIEAKGETSSKEGTNRYGMLFKGSQMLDHVAKAFYRAAKMLQQNDRNLPHRVGIALPDNHYHRKYVGAIEQYQPCEVNSYHSVEAF